MKQSHVSMDSFIEPMYSWMFFKTMEHFFFYFFLAFFEPMHDLTYDSPFV